VNLTPQMYIGSRHPVANDVESPWFYTSGYSGKPWPPYKRSQKTHRMTPEIAPVFIHPDAAAYLDVHINAVRRPAERHQGSRASGRCGTSRRPFRQNQRFTERRRGSPQAFYTSGRPDTILLVAPARFRMTPGIRLGPFKTLSNPSQTPLRYT